MELSLPPNLRISTITATSKINSYIKIEEVYDYLEINKHLKYIEYGNKSSKGVSQKIISQKKKAKKKIFFNQITIEVEYNNIINNIKLFNNGSISMTGVKNIDTGKGAIDTLFDYLKKFNTIFENPNPQIMFFKIVLINSDFRFNFEIKRSELHQLLVNKYNIYSSYEPCIYPGVNSKYYWNHKYTNRKVYAKGYKKDKDVLYISYDVDPNILPSKLKAEMNTFEYKEKYMTYLEQLLGHRFKSIDYEYNRDTLCLRFYINSDECSDWENKLVNVIENGTLELHLEYKYKGSCYCDGFCDGKGLGDGEQECKKVTISAFQSGSVIITGANTSQQITDSYNFINTIINDNIDTIKKDKSLCNIKQDDFIYIKKSSIVRPT